MSETTQNATATETKPTKTKAGKKPVKAKAAAPKTKTAKAAKPKAEKPPKAPREDRSDWQTFALRLPKSEAAALHKAAGPANASRTMRALAAAFVTEDRAVFEAIVEEARQLR
jgi:hypothetical protein